MQAKHGGLPAHRSRPLSQGALRSARLAAGKGRSRCLRGEIKPRSSPETDAGAGKAFDAAGAGKSWSSPGWLTQLGRLWGGETDTPVADAKPEDIQDLLGGALFQALYKWMLETGPVYLLPTGPVSSFLVVSDPEAARHVLRNTDSAKPVYDKGLVAEVSKFLFGDGFAVAGGENWKVRRKAVGPAFHRKYLEAMLERVFAPSALHLAEKLDEPGSREGRGYNMEAGFSQMTLDVVGKAVFNYSFDSLTQDSPVIQAVYTALKETEQRATDLLPYWKVPLLCHIIPRQRKAMAAVQLIRDTTEELIQKCKEMVDAEEAAQFAQEEDYMNEADPSVLRFLIASREEVSASQLRDDLLSMLVAGHETTASALTWTVYLLCQNPTQMARAQEEVDRVLGDSDAPTTLRQYQELKYVMRCVNESMRLYPHPPVLLRRALVEDTLPGGYSVPVGQDVMISVYNIHHSPAVWDRPDDFLPERFDLDKPTPNEQNTNCRYIPFSGGPRKCIGDQFALMEAVVVLSALLKRFDMRLVPDQEIQMTTGATIHTTNGLYIYAQRRAACDAPPTPTEVTSSLATSA